MAFGQLSANSKTSRQVGFALSLIVTCAAACQVASAQESQSGEQDSLLPPEVVPLDPGTASSMVAKQAQRRAQLGGDSGTVPGLSVGYNNQPGMMTAQQARQSAFNSLYGRGQVPQNGSMQWQSGVIQDQPIGQNGPMGSPNGNQMGNPAGNPMAMGQNPVNPGYAPYQAANGGPGQSQTLTGGSKTQSKIQDIKRSGVSNTLSAVAGFGAGALTAGALMHPQNPMVGLGIFGLTMSGFGVRNAFRF